MRSYLVDELAVYALCVLSFVAFKSSLQCTTMCAYLPGTRTRLTRRTGFATMTMWTPQACRRVFGIISPGEGEC